MINRLPVLRLLIGLTPLVLFNCAPFSKPELLQANKLSTSIKSQWTSYGAYYNFDELFVEASYLESPFIRGPLTKFIVNRHLKILTKEGTRYATMRIPRYGQMNQKFNIQVTDAKGKPVPINLTALKTQYNRGEKLVIPNVTAGCDIKIRIQGQIQGPVPFLEHYLSRPIPVHESRFTFSTIKRYHYDFKGYGGLPAPEIRSLKEGKLKYHVWSRKFVLPRSRLRFQKGIDETEPRVSLVMRSYEIPGLISQDRDLFNDWADLTEKYENQLLKESFFKSTLTLKKTVKKVTGDLQEEYARADAIFNWVQENISYKPSALGAINPDKVIKKKKGNLWEMAVILRKMFEYAGLQTDILVTRSHDRGGFDSRFVSPIVLEVPLVSVWAGKQEYLVFPYSNGALLGEYPTDFNNLEALSLNQKEIKKLPPAVSGESFSTTAVTLNLKNGNPKEAEMEMTITFGGILAYDMRNFCLVSEKKAIKEAFQKRLTAYDVSNQLQKFKLEGLKNRGKPLKAVLTFSNTEQAVSRKGKTQLKLSHVFDSFFETYDTSRVTVLHNDMEVNYRENLTLLLPKKGGVKKVFECKEQNNPLFTQNCQTEQSDGQVVIRRQVTVKKASLSKARMRKIQQEIVLLNAIDKSHLIIN